MPIRAVALAFLVCLLPCVADAKRVRTPRSENARAQGQTHKSNHKHAGPKVKVRKKREKYN